MAGRLGDAASALLLEGVTVASEETAIPHGLTVTPRSVFWAARANDNADGKGRARMSISESRAADAKNVYLQCEPMTVFSTFTGRNGSGEITGVHNAREGDVVVDCLGTVAGLHGSGAGQFESVITTDDEIQQTSASNLTALAFFLWLERANSVVADILVIP